MEGFAKALAQATEMHLLVTEQENYKASEKYCAMCRMIKGHRERKKASN